MRWINRQHSLERILQHGSDGRAFRPSPNWNSPPQYRCAAAAGFQNLVTPTRHRTFSHVTTSEGLWMDCSVPFEYVCLWLQMYLCIHSYYRAEKVMQKLKPELHDQHTHTEAHKEPSWKCHWQGESKIAQFPLYNNDNTVNTRIQAKNTWQSVNCPRYETIH